MGKVLSMIFLIVTCFSATYYWLSNKGNIISKTGLSILLFFILALVLVYLNFKKKEGV
jgi:hypothetical protein